MRAHADGQEFAYLSMFVKPDALQVSHGDNNLEQIYHQYSSQNPPLLQRHALRQLHSDDMLNSYSDRESDHASNIGLETLDESDMTQQDEIEDSDPQSDTLTSNQPSRSSMTPLTISGTTRLQMHQSDNASPSLEHSSATPGEDVQRLMIMLRKIVTQYDIQSMADVPCRAHAHWMAEWLEQIAEHNENFKYYCIDTNDIILKAVKERVGMTVDSKFVLRRFWKVGLPRVDMVFSWAGLDNMKHENVLRYIHKLSKTGRKHKLILLGSHSGSLLESANSEKIAAFTAGGTPINLRRRPFYMSKPMRIIDELSKDGNDKQLYIYRPWNMFPRDT